MAESIGMMRSFGYLFALQLIALLLPFVHDGVGSHGHADAPGRPAAHASGGGADLHMYAGGAAPMLPPSASLRFDPNLDSVDFGSVAIGLRRDTTIRITKLTS